jgi:hypothetical protein
MKKKKIYLLYVFILIVVSIISCTLWFTLNKTTSTSVEINKTVIERPKLKIIDESSNSRSIAVMINNHNYARDNHAGLQDAYVVYEMIVEGGITRLMAIFKDQTTEKIGSVRSSRHNFLDYAIEYDAIYVHYGWSELAKNDISTFQIDNINGLYDSSAFFRDNSLSVPWEHRAFTSMEQIKASALKKNYSLTSSKKIPLKYSVYSVNLEKNDDAIVADKITLEYSSYMTTSYEYDSSNKVYKRYANSKPHTDAITKEQYTFKNIIVMKVENNTIDSYGRQNLETTGTGDGYFITNGYARKITWTKESRTSTTEYKYLDGSDVILNDGNTFIQIQPISKETKIEAYNNE